MLQFGQRARRIERTRYPAKLTLFCALERRYIFKQRKSGCLRPPSSAIWICRFCSRPGACLDSPEGSPALFIFHTPFGARSGADGAHRDPDRLRLSTAGCFRSRASGPSASEPDEESELNAFDESGVRPVCRLSPLRWPPLAFVFKSDLGACAGVLKGLSPSTATTNERRAQVERLISPRRPSPLARCPPSERNLFPSPRRPSWRAPSQSDSIPIVFHVDLKTPVPTAGFSFAFVSSDAALPSALISMTPRTDPTGDILIGRA